MPTQLTKYLQRKLDSQSWPTLLVFKDKYSTEYYLCDSHEAVGRACLKVLEERMTCNYLQHPGPEEKIWGIKEELPKAAAEALPEPYREQALGVIKRNAQLRAQWQEDVETYNNAKKAIKKKDGNLAFMILHERRDYEYEGFTFETPIIP